MDDPPKRVTLLWDGLQLWTGRESSAPLDSRVHYLLEPTKTSESVPMVSDLPEEIKVDGYKLMDGLIELWGIAIRAPYDRNGLYRCHANVGGNHCIVEIRVTPVLVPTHGNAFIIKGEMGETLECIDSWWPIQ